MHTDRTFFSRFIFTLILLALAAVQPAAAQVHAPYTTGKHRAGVQYLESSTYVVGGYPYQLYNQSDQRSVKELTVKKSGKLYLVVTGARKGSFTSQWAPWGTLHVEVQKSDGTTQTQNHTIDASWFDQQSSAPIGDQDKTGCYLAWYNWPGGSENDHSRLWDTYYSFDANLDAREHYEIDTSPKNWIDVGRVKRGDVVRYRYDTPLSNKKACGDASGHIAGLGVHAEPGSDHPVLDRATEVDVQQYFVQQPQIMDLTVGNTTHRGGVYGGDTEMEYGKQKAVLMTPKEETGVRIQRGGAMYYYAELDETGAQLGELASGAPTYTGGAIDKVYGDHVFAALRVDELKYIANGSAQGLGRSADVTITAHPLGWPNREKSYTLTVNGLESASSGDEVRHEAEAADYSRSITRKNDGSASGGSYLDMTDSGSIYFDVLTNTAGDKTLTVGYRLDEGAPKKQNVYVNGNWAGKVTFDGQADTWLEKDITVGLREGTNTVRIAKSWGWMDIDYLSVPKEDAPSLYEAEAAGYNGSITQKSDGSASGGSYLDMTDSGSITFSNVEASQAGSYNITLRYKMAYGNPKEQNISVNNGQTYFSTKFYGNDSQWKSKQMPVYLEAGSNTIQIQKSWGWMQFDYLKVAEAPAAKRSISMRKAAEPTQPTVLKPAYPNPVRNQATVRFAVEETGPVTVTLYDALGRQVSALYRGTPKAGQLQTLTVEAGDLPSGVYIMRLQGAGISKSQTLTIAH